MLQYTLFAIVSFFSLFTVPSYTQEDVKIIENQARIPILTPSFAEHQTLKLRLANGLEVYLISDPEATKSAASLTVQAGSWQDPPEYPGLAHFLEHMLFLGTEKYPIESDYDRFIKEHDGESNAYTASDYTLYVFAINNDAFEEALDRFAYFFKKPLFNPSGVERELQAIDQEFAKNFTDDDVREHYVLKELANPAHPFHRFSGGNSSTLSQVSQKTLRQWYQDHYSANLMRLVVYSSLPLDTLKKLVVQDFKDISNSNRSFLHMETPLLSDSSKGSVVYIEPLKDLRAVRLVWEVPSRFAHMDDTKPEQVICSVLGHEGPESLLNELKKENLAENLGCQGYRLGPDNSLFSLYIELTEEGLEKVNQVVEMCLQAIVNLRQHGIPAYIFDELKKMDTIRYQYQAREIPFDYVMQLNEWLTREKLETFPEQSAILQRFDPQAIQDLLKELTPQNLFITILAKPDATGILSEQREHWMGIPYTVRNFSPEQLHLWRNTRLNPQLQIPPPNPFIPQELHLSQPAASIHKNQIPYPETILDNKNGKIYYAKDLYFQIPKTFWSFEIKTPSIERGHPLKVVLADLYIKCLEEALNPYSYNATLADLNYEIQRVENGINLTLSGYSDNAERLFDAILERLKTCQPTEQSFLTFKDSLLRQYQNFAEESPLDQGLETYQSLVYKGYSTNKQKAAAIQTVTYPQLLAYISSLFAKTYTLSLFYGNIEKAQALQLANKLQTTLNSQVSYLPEEQLAPQILVLPANQGPFYLKTSIKAPGFATILGIEDPVFSFQTRAAQQILMQAMNGPFYSTLRTQQQTGYLVYSKGEEIEKHLFNLFFVQSNSHDPRDLLARFELFIEGFLQEMSKTDLTPEKFEIIRNSLLTTMEQPPQSLSEMGKLLKNLAFKYDGDFDWINKRILGFKELTYENFLEMATQSLGKNNKRRLAVLVYGSPLENKIFRYIRLSDMNEIKKLADYTSNKPSD